MNTLFLDTLTGKQSQKTPFWFMRQAGRYLPEYRKLRAGCDGFMDLCFTPQKAAEVTLQPIRRFNMDAAILFSDILVIPYALGQQVGFVTGEGPKLNSLIDEAAIDALSYQPEMLNPIYETVARVREELAQDKTLIGFSGSPWTLACYMIEGGGSKDFAQTQRFSARNPEAFARLLSVQEAAIIDYLGKQVEAGAGALQLFDSWAGLCSAANFDAYVVAPTQRIVRAMKQRYPHIPIIGFPRLSGIGYRRYVKETGVDGVSIDTQIIPQWAKSHLSEYATVQGNLDPLLLAMNGEKAVDEAKRLVEAYAEVPYIFNLGHGFVPDTPIEHVEMLVNYLHSLR